MDLRKLTWERHTVASSPSRSTTRHPSIATGPVSPSIFREKKLARLIRTALAVGSGLAVPVANADLDCNPIALTTIIVDTNEINQLACTLNVDLEITPTGVLTNSVTGTIDNFETMIVDGALDNAGDLLNHNRVQVGATGWLDVSGFLGNGAPGTNSPLLEIADGGTLHIHAGGEYSTYGSTMVSGSVINDQYYFNDNTTIIGASASVVNNFVFNSANLLDIGGSYTNSPGSFMTVWAGFVNILGGGLFHNGGDTTIRGHIVGEENSVLINEGTLSIGTSFITNSTLETHAFSTVSNAVGSTFTNWGESTVGGDAFFNGTAVNEGTYITTETGNTVIGSPGNFLNKGLSETFGILNIESGGTYDDEGETFIRAAGKLLVAGDYLGDSSSVLTIQGATNAVLSGGVIDTQGEVDLEGGLKIETNGLLAIGPNATLALVTGSVLDNEGWAWLDGTTTLGPGSSFVNKGTAEFGYSGYTNATLTLDPGSFVTNAVGGTTFNYGTHNVNGRWVNEGTDNNFGTVNVGPAGEYVIEVGAQTNNYALIDSFGVLKIRGTLNDHGETRISGDGHMELDGTYVGTVDALLKVGGTATNSVTGVIDTSGDIHVDADATLNTSEGSSVRLNSASVTIAGAAFFNDEVLASNSVFDNTNILEFGSTGSALTLDTHSVIFNASQAQLTIGGVSTINGGITNDGNLNFEDTTFFRGSLENNSLTRIFGTLWVFEGSIVNEDFVQNFGAISQFGDFTNAGFGSGLVQNLLGANWSVNNGAVYANDAQTTNSGSFLINLGGTVNNTVQFDNRNFMALRNGGAFTNSPSGVVINFDGATLDVEDTLSNQGEVRNRDGEVNITATGSISGSGSYVQEDGLTIVDGSINLPAIEFQAGTLRGNGLLISDNPVLIANGVDVDPGGSVGSLTFDSDVAFDGTLTIEIESTTSFDTIDVLGTMTFGAGSEIVFDLTGYSPLAGDTFEFLTALSISGFENVLVSMPGLDPLLTYSLAVDGEFDLVLQYSNVPIPPSLPLLAAPIAALGLLRRARLRTTNA